MEHKIYFNPGEPVMIKHDELYFRPVMIVLGKKSVTEDAASQFTPSEGSSLRQESKKVSLLGIECFWFDQNMCYHTHVFNTKDLVHIVE